MDGVTQAQAYGFDEYLIITHKQPALISSPLS